MTLNKIAIIGKIDDAMSYQLKIPEHSGKIIKCDISMFNHARKHKEEYMSEESYLYTIEHFLEIINDPDMVCHNKQRSSLEFYKLFKEYVAAIVGLTKKKDLYVNTLYPTDEDKVITRQKQIIYIPGNNKRD